MPGFLTDVQAREVVANALKKESSSLENWWFGIVTRANVSGWQEVLGQLVKRGYTQAQVLAWDRGQEFQSDCMLYRALVTGGALEGFSSEFIKAIDRRKELETVQVFINGDFVNPSVGTSGPGQVGSGPAVGVGRGSLFTWPPSDLNTNDEIRW